MTAKNKPATPLPWTADNYPGFIYSKVGDRAYIKRVKKDEAFKIHSANSYAGLVETLQEIAEHAHHARRHGVSILAFESIRDKARAALLKARETL